MQHHLTALQGLALPEALTSLLQQLVDAIQGVDTPLSEKQTRLRLLEQLAQMRDALSLPPRRLPLTPPHTGEEPLAQPVQFLRGVGPKRAALLHKLHIYTVNDLLWCIPIRYEDRRQPAHSGYSNLASAKRFVARSQRYKRNPVDVASHSWRWSYKIKVVY